LLSFTLPWPRNNLDRSVNQTKGKTKT